MEKEKLYALISENVIIAAAAGIRFCVHCGKRTKMPQTDAKSMAVNN